MEKKQVCFCCHFPYVNAFTQCETYNRTMQGFLLDFSVAYQNHIQATCTVSFIFNSDKIFRATPFSGRVSKPVFSTVGCYVPFYVKYKVLNLYVQRLDNKKSSFNADELHVK